MIKLTLPLPPRNNVYYRHNRGVTHLSKEGRLYKTTVHELALIRGIVRPLDGEVRITTNVYRARRAGDLDGYFKGLFDSLNGVAYNDDGQIVELHAYRDDDKHNPRVEVTIEAAQPRESVLDDTPDIAQVLALLDGDLTNETRGDLLYRVTAARAVLRRVMAQAEDDDGRY